MCVGIYCVVSQESLSLCSPASPRTGAPPSQLPPPPPVTHLQLVATRKRAAAPLTLLGWRPRLSTRRHRHLPNVSSLWIPRGPTMLTSPDREVARSRRRSRPVGRFHRDSQLLIHLIDSPFPKHLVVPNWFSCRLLSHHCSLVPFQLKRTLERWTTGFELMDQKPAVNSRHPFTSAVRIGIKSEENMRDDAPPLQGT